MYDKEALEEFTTACGLKRYRVPVSDPALNRHRFISSDTPEFTLHKAALQEKLWVALAEQRAEEKRRRLGLEMNGKRSDLTARQKQKIAEDRTVMAREEFSHTFNTLEYGLQHPLDFNWDFFRTSMPFSVPRPSVSAGKEPTPPIYPREPQRTDFAYTPKYEAMDVLRPGRKQQKDKEAQERFREAHKHWQRLCGRMKYIYDEQMADHTRKLRQATENLPKELAAWEQAKAEYEQIQEMSMSIVQAKEEALAQHDPHAVLDYFDMALATSSYPAAFPHSFEMDYKPATQRLIVDYLLPSLKALPRLVTVVYNEVTDSFSDQIITVEQQAALYTKLFYEIPLRTFQELFSLDTSDALQSIRFRGYLFLEQAGAERTNLPPTCIVDVKAERSVFTGIGLRESDAISTFEKLGGVIHSLV